MDLLFIVRVVFFKINQVLPIGDSPEKWAAGGQGHNVTGPSLLVLTPIKPWRFFSVPHAASMVYFSVHLGCSGYSDYLYS